MTAVVPPGIYEVGVRQSTTLVAYTVTVVPAEHAVVHVQNATGVYPFVSAGLRCGRGMVDHTAA